MTPEMIFASHPIRLRLLKSFVHGDSSESLLRRAQLRSPFPLEKSALDVENRSICTIHGGQGNEEVGTTFACRGGIGRHSCCSDSVKQDTKDAGHATKDA